MKKLLTSAALLGAMAAAAVSVPAQAAGVRIGTLACHEAGGWGLILGSSHKVRCLFTSNAEHDRPEVYEGSISKFGVDLGYQASAVIVWAVLAPTNHLGHGDLAGSYGGATANAAVGVGAGANVLLGGLEKSVALQPVSITGETGFNVAAGVGALTLKSGYDRDRD
jgi:hypothetical protein